MKKVVAIFSFIFMVVLTGCGGGGGGGDDYGYNEFPSAPSPSQMARITPDNSDEIVLSVYRAILGSNDYKELDIFSRKVSPTKPSFRSMKELSLRILNKRLVRDYCDVGSMDINRITSTEVEINYNNCEISGTRYNGYAHIYKNGDRARIVFKYFTARNLSETLAIRKAEFIVQDNIFEIKSMYAKYEGKDDKVEFLNYSSKVITDEYNNWVVVNVNGYIKTKCSKGFVKVKTAPEVKIYTNSGEIEGTLEISSRGDMITLLFEDGMVYITNTIDTSTVSLSLDEFKKLESSTYCD